MIITEIADLKLPQSSFRSEAVNIAGVYSDIVFVNVRMRIQRFFLCTRYQMFLCMTIYNPKNNFQILKESLKEYNFKQPKNTLV